MPDPRRSAVASGDAKKNLVFDFRERAPAPNTNAGAFEIQMALSCAGFGFNRRGDTIPFQNLLIAPDTDNGNWHFRSYSWGSDFRFGAPMNQCTGFMNLPCQAKLYGGVSRKR
jgi:hypothetical protein